MPLTEARARQRPQTEKLVARATFDFSWPWGAEKYKRRHKRFGHAVAWDEASNSEKVNKGGFGSRFVRTTRTHLLQPREFWVARHMHKHQTRERNAPINRRIDQYTKSALEIRRNSIVKLCACGVLCFSPYNLVWLSKKKRMSSRAPRDRGSIAALPDPATFYRRRLFCAAPGGGKGKKRHPAKAILAGK